MQAIVKTAESLAAVAVLAVAAMAVAAADEQNAGDVEARIDHGKITYAEKCSHCHGPGMLNAGTITPDLRRFSGDKERFFTTVKNGRNNRMPPWGDLLDDEQIGALWAYISSKKAP